MRLSWPAHPVVMAIVSSVTAVIRRQAPVGEMKYLPRSEQGSHHAFGCFQLGDQLRGIDRAQPRQSGFHEKAPGPGHPARVASELIPPQKGETAVSCTVREACGQRPFAESLVCVDFVG